MMRSAWILYGLLVLASVVYCLGLFGGLYQWGRGDWDQFSFRYQTPRTAMLRDRQLPLWNPYVNGGNVLLAHPHCPAFSPWYLPTLVLGAPLGLRFQVLLFVALGTTGMGALLRRWKVSPAGCFLGGVMLMMSAHFTMHITEGHLEWCVLGLMPWVTLCLVRAEEDRVEEKGRFVVLGALLLASGLLHGSIYIVVIFAPLLVIWAALESIRTRSWRPLSRNKVASCAATMGLTFLLCAVVLFPRLEFLGANPRDTQRHEQVAPAALGRMLLDPHQLDLYRATRDVRNPPDEELARLLPARLPLLAGKWAAKWAAEKWHRLDVTLTTTSDWTALRFEGFRYVLFLGEPEPKDKTSRELDDSPLSTEGIAIKDSTAGKTETRRATLYARVPGMTPEWGGMQFVLTRGDDGATELTVTRNKRQLLGETHYDVVPDDPGNHLRLTIPRRVILAPDWPDQGGSDAPWYRLEATLETNADWCNVRVANCPYLFHVEPPEVELEASLRPFTRPLVVSSNPSRKKFRLRAVLYVQPPEDDGLRLKIAQGLKGASTLTLTTPEGELLETVSTEPTESDGQKTCEYLLSKEVIEQQLEGLPIPIRWQLDEWGMIYGWHEYGCYVTWLGLALAVVGVIVSFRRLWPLCATAMIAGLVAMGAALPLNFWAPWKLLPMYASLQVPSRFLAGVVFVTAICGGFGLDRLGRWVERTAGLWPRRLLEWGLVTAIYIELAVLGWNLFSDIFVCPKRAVPAHEDQGFAQRYAEDGIRYAAMYSAHYPYLRDNSGVLREYENIAVPRGKIRLKGQPNYRGEAWLEGEHGTAKIDDWTMSRVNVALEVQSPNRLVLNQNYFLGWKAIRRDAAGTSEKLTAEEGPKGTGSEGLVSIAVRPGDREVKFYYLPDSFLWGAAVSGLTLLGCLGFLLARGSRGWTSRGLTRLAVRITRRWDSAFQPRSVRYLACGVALNLSFLVCHPGWTLAGTPLVRSLAINLVLFLAPGLPLVGAMIGRGRLPRFGLLWAMAASLTVFVAVLVGAHLAGVPAAGRAAWSWNATWILTNLGLLLNVVFGGPPAFGVRLHGKCAWIGLLSFAVAYLTLFRAATEVVPVMDDHDYETQGTAHSLVTQLQMKLLTDRHTVFCYAHPPLVHACVAGSFLYYGQLDELAYYDDAWDRVHLAEDGISVQDTEAQMLYGHFRQNAHHRLATRTPNVFLSALTVGLLGWWIVRMTGYGWLGLLVALAYVTNPEVFVRSSCGGYFAVSMFAVVQILLAAERWTKDRSRAAWMNCLLAGVFAGLANHKLVLLPIALVAWELMRLGRGCTPKQAAKTLLTPVAVGFAAGTLIFWTYGLAVSPGVFWLEHVRHHLVDRIVHHNPLGYGKYPTITGLWLELWQHTGYVLLPLGIAALGVLCFMKPAPKENCEISNAVPGWRDTPGLWALWVLLTAVAFSLIDWRQTKHLMPLLLPMYLAPVRWAASRRTALLVVSVLFAGLLTWNLGMLRLLATDFDSFTITPAW